MYAGGTRWRWMHRYKIYEWVIRWMYEGEGLCRGTKCIQVKDVDYVLDTCNEWNVGILECVWNKLSECNGIAMSEWNCGWMNVYWRLWICIFIWNINVVMNGNLAVLYFWYFLSQSVFLVTLFSFPWNNGYMHIPCMDTSCY